jgi:hypothetical protein
LGRTSSSRVEPIARPLAFQICANTTDSRRFIWSSAWRISSSVSSRLFGGDHER